MSAAPSHTLVVVVAVHGPVDDGVPAVPGLLGWSVLRAHRAEPPTQPAGIAAVVTARLRDDVTPDPASWFPGPIDAYRVDERVVIAGIEPTATPYVVQCSFVRRRAELTRAEFAAHWHDVHAPLVPVHHPGVARYVQHVVVEPLSEDAPEVDGIAQLGFATAHDYHERYYDSPEGRALVGADVARFIDRPLGWRMTAEETTLRP